MPMASGATSDFESLLFRSSPSEKTTSIFSCRGGIRFTMSRPATIPS